MHDQPCTCMQGVPPALSPAAAGGGYQMLQRQLAGVIAGAVAGRYLRDVVGYSAGVTDGAKAAAQHDATILGGVAGFFVARSMGWA